MSDGLKVFWGICAAIVVAAVIWVLAVFVFGTASSETANFRGGVDQRNQTNGNGQYRIAQYNDFYVRCNALLAAQNQIDADADPANSVGLPVSIAATNHQANKQDYIQRAGEYNTKASATATSGQFRDSGLPYSVPTTYVPNGAKITCGS